MIEKGTTYTTTDGKEYTVINFGDADEDGGDVILELKGKGGRRVTVIKSLRQVVREIAATLTH